jgi:hypothetical protein
MLRGVIQFRGLAAMLGRGHGVAAKAFRDMIRNGMADAGLFWHTHFLPMHFTTAAAGRYPYEDRTQRYMIRKGRVKGHRNPLEYSGTLKRLVTGHAEIRATSRGVRVRMTGPPWLRKPGRPTEGQPDLGAELTMTNQAEMQELAVGLDRRFYNDLMQNRTTFRLTAGEGMAAAG